MQLSGAVETRPTLDLHIRYLLTCSIMPFSFFPWNRETDNVTSCKCNTKQPQTGKTTLKFGRNIYSNVKEKKRQDWVGWKLVRCEALDVTADGTKYRRIRNIYKCKSLYAKGIDWELSLQRNYDKQAVLSHVEMKKPHLVRITLL